MRGALGKARDASQNLIGAFGPGKGFGVGVVGVEELGDGALQFVHAAVRPTPDLLAGQLREPAFHQLQPGAVGRGEVQVIAGPLGELRPDERRFVDSVIVQDDVDLKIGRHAVVNSVQELAELQRAMAAMGRADYVAALGVERGKQRGGAMRFLVVGAPLALPGPQALSRGTRR